MKKKLACLLTVIFMIGCLVSPVYAETTRITQIGEVHYISSGSQYIEAYSPGNFGNQILTGDITRYGTYLLIFLGTSMTMLILVLTKKYKDEFKTTDLRE